MAEAPDFAVELYCGTLRLHRRIVNGAIVCQAQVIEPPCEAVVESEAEDDAVRLAVAAAVGAPVQIRELAVHARDVRNLYLSFTAEVHRGDPTAPCGECRGTGQYVGFTAIEPCRACGGDGRAR